MEPDDYEPRNNIGLSLEGLRLIETADFLPPSPDPYRATLADLNRHAADRDWRAAANAKYRARGDVSAAAVADLRSEQGDACAYCGCDLERGGQLDHIIPVPLGGTSDIGNLAWTCTRCNQRKRNMTPEEWESERGLVMP